MNNKIKIARQLRKNQTKAEKKLWGKLRNRQFQNLKFRRQHPLKDYIVAFFCEEYGIVIALDGDRHNQPNQKEKDGLRDIHLKNLGYHVLRFENHSVFNNIAVIFQSIERAKDKQEEYAMQRREQLAKRKDNRNQRLSPKRGRCTVLSTKVLGPSQKSLALNAGLRLVEYNAISINHLNFKLPKEHFDALIFTSQNGVKAYLEHLKGLSSHGNQGVGIKRALCVGEKTKWFLEENRFEVIAFAQNAEELGKTITKSYHGLKLLWPTGTQRRNEMPTMLKKGNVEFTELTVYETVANPKKLETTFDGILFFSPSAVSSFVQNNSISGTAFCIGNTTAEEVKKYTENYFVANKPTIENVLVQAVKRLNTND